jgi:hypothetical protein
MARVIKGRVSFRDFSYDSIVEMVNPTYKDHKDLIAKAYDKHYSNHLSYNCDTGVTRNKELGQLSKYSNSDEIPTYTNMDDILLDQFMPILNNSVSRLLRGYEA